MNRTLIATMTALISLIVFSSCRTQTELAAITPGKIDTEEISVKPDESGAETMYFSELVKQVEPVSYLSCYGEMMTFNTEINDPGIIGMSMTEKNKLITSDRSGNINIYRKSSGRWKHSEKMTLYAEGVKSFTAFSADSSFICLYSDLTDSLYLFPYMKQPSKILKLYTSYTSFSREITDIDMEEGYIYIIDTENRVSIIDYKKDRFETELFLDSRLSLRSIAVMQNKDTSSLAAVSPGSDLIHIFPMSEQYLMVREKGFIKTAGITSFNYGTHVLVSGNGEILYALESSSVDLSDFTKGEATVTGKIDPDYPVDGGPEFLSVSDVRK